MENTEIYTNSTDYKAEEPEKEKHRLTPSESVFFDELAKNLKKYAADMTAPRPLETLCENFRRLHRLFTIFAHPWLAESGTIQKACAWYVACARPAEDEVRRLTEALNGFTVSACYLAEWSELIIQMKKFFRTEAKELKHLFDYRKKMEHKHREHQERLAAEGPAYCLTIGGEEIYGVLYPQIEELYRVMGRFIEREKAPFQCKIKGYEEYGVSISKDISLWADRDEFYIDYSLGTFEYDLACMPAATMQRVADIISDFLKVFGENGDRKVRWDITDYPVESQPDIAFEIKEDSRLPTFRTVPWVNKSICRDEGEETEITYFVDINETHSPELSFGEFVAVYRKLGDFLQNQPKSVDLAGE